MADKDRVSQVRDTLKKMQKNLECSICLELLSDPYTTQCGHPFCRICIYTVISSNREARCPLCKEPISKRSMNENSRLGEIVEAVKQLEQAIIEDTGIPKTPPRPLPPHSHEATGSPGIALHSKLHPSPRKKPYPRSKRTKSNVDLSASTSSQAALSIFNSPAQRESTADTRSDTGIPKPGDRYGRGKLSIKRRRKKVKFSMEKPTALLHVARKVSTSSPNGESAASSSRNLLSMFAEQEERMESGNGKLEVAAEQAGMENGNGNMETIFMEEVSDFRNEGGNEGASYPARKKARLDSSPMTSAKINTTLSQEVPCSSQQLSHDVSRILETPAPQFRHNNFTISINRVILSNRFTIRPKIDSNKPCESEEKNHDNALNQAVGSPQPSSPKLCAALSSSKDQGIEIYRPQPLAVVTRETPFIQTLGLSTSSSVTRVMETPFISNIQVPSDDEEIVTIDRRSSDGDHNVEQCDSILANETVDDHHTLAPEKARTQTENMEDLFSDSILAKETQDTADLLTKSDKSSSDDNLAGDGSCTILGPTQVTSVPESQFSRSAIIPKPRAVSHQLSQIVDASPLSLQKVEKGHKVQSQHDTRSSSGSQSSVVCSPVQSGGTVCIGETQFTKSESKLSPEEGQTAVVIPPIGTCTMPSPPVSPNEIQSPIIPLQNSNSTHLPHSCRAVQVSQQLPSGSVSKIAETQLSSSSDHGIVPSSQPSPTPSKRQPAAYLKLPGLMTVQYRKPQPQATVVDDDRISLEQQEKKEDMKKNFESQTVAGQQNEGRHSTKSPSKSLALEQNENDHKAELAIAVAPAQSSAYVNISSSMSLAYSTLQSQRASLQSQISSSMDLSSQQLELLQLEMEAKQREIDELEAALRQVEEEEKEVQPETPAFSTQSSVRSITAIAETMPSKNGQMVSPDHVSYPEHYSSELLENPLSGHRKSNTDSAGTMPSNNRQTLSPKEGMCLGGYASESVENPLSDHTKTQEHSQVALLPTLTRSPDVYALESVDNPMSGHTGLSEQSQLPKGGRSPDETVPESLVTSSQLSREHRSMEHSQVRLSTSTFSSQIPSNESVTMKVQAVVKRTAPSSHTIAAMEKVKPTQHQSQIETAEDLPAHANKITSDSSVDVKSVGKTALSMHSEIKNDTESDTTSEAPCTSQSVIATLQAADEVLRKLRSPPLAVLEERSSMEIDTDLYSSGTSAPRKTSLKAKKLRISTDAAKTTGVTHMGLVQKNTVNSVQATCTLEVDSRLSTSSNKEEISAKRGKGSTITSRGKRAHSAPTKSKSKKTKKAPLVLFESEDAPIARPPEFRNQNQATPSKSSSNAVTGAKASELNSSSPCLPSIAQSPDRGHCSREGGRGSTTPTYRVVVLQTPKTQCSSNSVTTATSSGSRREVSAVSPCRPLSNIGKDHPPSYVGSGLSKTQLHEVQALARRHGGRLASCFNCSTSHVVVSADENGLCSRTVKYLQGVATGRWIVTHQWVTESLDAERLLPESEYEVVGDHVTTTITRAPMRSRQLHLKECPGLFADCAFLFVGAFGGISQDHLAQLIQLSGGTLVSSIDESATLGNSKTCVVCDEKRIQLPKSGSGLVHVKSEWILNCISNYSVLPISSSQYRQDDS